MFRRRFDPTRSYRQWVARSLARHGEQGWGLSIGGEFAAFGMVQRDLLIHYGLRPADTLVEIGCGAGRLVQAIRSHLDAGRYIGIDIVPDLVARARLIANRPDWRFELARGFTIPCPDDGADMVCCFSVFTHLLHEQTYLYLEEAVRVTRPGGLIVFSFLEFAMGFQWDVFAAMIAEQRKGGEHPLNMFIERGAISAWAARLGLEVVEFRAGDDPFVPLSEPVTLDDGRVMEERGNLGQSVCVLRVPV